MNAMDAPRKMSTALNEIRDECIDDVVLVTQLPSQSWFEGFALRPNGHILATRLDEPELYMWDVSDPDASPKLVHEFPGASGLVNICALPGKPDTYVIIAGIINMGEVIFEDFVLWELAFESSDPSVAPKITKLMEMENVGMTIGLTPVSGDTLLIADSSMACIWTVDLPTRSTRLLVKDESMEAASAEDFFGINRMCIVNDHVWFTNSSKGILGRIPIIQEPATGEFAGRSILLKPGAEVDGSYVQKIATDLVHCDGLSVLPGGAAAYTASYNDGLLWKVEVDRETGKGEVTTVMSNLVNPTAVELTMVDGRARLFIICNGEIDITWVSSSDRMSWSDLKGFNEMVTVSTVTTTEEVSY